jgi:hypothetical protein
MKHSLHIPCTDYPGRDLLVTAYPETLNRCSDKSLFFFPFSIVESVVRYMET